MTTQGTTWKKVRVALAAAGLLVSAALVARGTEAGAASADQARVQEHAAVSVGLSASTVDLLANYRVFVVPMPDTRSVISSSVAVDRAFHEFGGILGAKAPYEQGLVLLTIPDLGVEHEPDPSKPSKISPLYIGRAAWALIYDDIEVPLVGKPASEDGELSLAEQQATPGDETNTYRAPFVIFLDARTGEFLDAESL